MCECGGRGGAGPAGPLGWESGLLGSHPGRSWKHSLPRGCSRSLRRILLALWPPSATWDPQQEPRHLVFSHLVGRESCRPRREQQEERRDVGKPWLSLSGAGWEHQEPLQQQLLAMRVPAQPPQRGTVLLPSHHPHARGGVSYSNKNAPFHLGDCSQFEMKTFVPEIGVIPGIATPGLCFQLICSSRHAFPSALAQRREIWRWLCAEMPAEMCTVRNEEKAAPAHSSWHGIGVGGTGQLRNGWRGRGGEPDRLPPGRGEA